MLSLAGSGAQASPPPPCPAALQPPVPPASLRSPVASGSRRRRTRSDDSAPQLHGTRTQCTSRHARSPESAHSNHAIRPLRLRISYLIRFRKPLRAAIGQDRKQQHPPPLPVPHY